VTERRIIHLPVTLDAANRRKDRSLSIRVSSTQEVPNVEFAVIDQFVGHSGHFAFSEDVIQAADIPKANTEAAEGKTPSTRLRGVLYVLWSQADQSEPFDTVYYPRAMNRIIEHYKQEID
jgi:hypothetical protein